MPNDVVMSTMWSATITASSKSMICALVRLFIAWSKHVFMPGVCFSW